MLTRAIQIGLNNDGSEEYYVEKIVDHKLQNNRKLYRVRWKGYSSDNDTWETEQTLRKVKNLIRQYENSIASIQ